MGKILVVEANLGLSGEKVFTPSQAYIEECIKENGNGGIAWDHVECIVFWSLGTGGLDKFLPDDGHGQQYYTVKTEAWSGKIPAYFYFTCSFSEKLRPLQEKIQALLNSEDNVPAKFIFMTHHDDMFYKVCDSRVKMMFFRMVGAGRPSIKLIDEKTYALTFKGKKTVRGTKIEPICVSEKLDDESLRRRVIELQQQGLNKAAGSIRAYLNKKAPAAAATVDPDAPVAVAEEAVVQPAAAVAATVDPDAQVAAATVVQETASGAARKATIFGGSNNNIPTSLLQPLVGGPVNNDGKECLKVVTACRH